MVSAGVFSHPKKCWSPPPKNTQTQEEKLISVCKLSPSNKKKTKKKQKKNIYIYCIYIYIYLSLVTIKFFLFRFVKSWVKECHRFPDTPGALGKNIGEHVENIGVIIMVFQGCSQGVVVQKKTRAFDQKIAPKEPQKTPSPSLVSLS